MLNGGLGVHDQRLKHVVAQAMFVELPASPGGCSSPAYGTVPVESYEEEAEAGFLEQVEGCVPAADARNYGEGLRDADSQMQ